MSNDAPAVLTPFFPGPDRDYDVIRRVRGNFGGVEEIVAARPTASFVVFFQDLFQTVEERTEFLFDVIKRQKKLLDYNSHYNAFLLNQISEAEFVGIAEKYLFTPEDQPEEKIRDRVFFLMSKIDEPLSSSELSYMLNCTEEEIEKALEGLKKEKVITHKE